MDALVRLDAAGLAALARRLAASVCAGDRLLVLSDFDGTLAPIAPDPASVALGPETRHALEALAGHDRVRVGIVSGRALRDVRERVGVAGLVYAGCHGLEVDGPGVAFTHPVAEAERAALAALARALAARLGGEPGVVVEDKGLAVALHYRSAPPGAGARLAREARRIVRGRPGLELLRGRKVVEILPRAPWSKGACACWLRDAVFDGSPGPVAALYLGDDATDESAFRALAGRAVTIRIGGRAPSAAAYRLPGAAAAGRLLAALAASLGEHP